METTNDTAFLAGKTSISDEANRIRMYVIFAFDMNEREQWINRRPVDFCDAMGLRETLALLAKEYGNNVLFEPVKECEVSDTEWEQLRALQFAEPEADISEDNWDEYICLPEGVCTACGGTGYLTMDCCDDGQRYELRGDCDECDASGQ